VRLPRSVDSRMAEPVVIAHLVSEGRQPCRTPDILMTMDFMSSARAAHIGSDNGGSVIRCGQSLSRSATHRANVARGARGNEKRPRGPRACHELVLEGSCRSLIPIAHSAPLSKSGLVSRGPNSAARAGAVSRSASTAAEVIETGHITPSLRCARDVAVAPVVPPGRRVAGGDDASCPRHNRHLKPRRHAPAAPPVASSTSSRLTGCSGNGWLRASRAGSLHVDRGHRFLLATTKSATRTAGSSVL
jgi:hypothetical protein